MASPPSINRGVKLPRVLPWKGVEDSEKWAQGLLRALELQFGLGGPGGGLIGTGRFSPLSITQGLNIIEPSAYPYTPQVSDLIILVDSSATRDIDLPGSSLGFNVTIKDFTGNAGANDINVNALAGQFIDGSATYVMNSNYEAITILGTGIVGSEWVIF